MSPADRVKAVAFATKIARVAFDVATGNREDASQAAREILGMLVDMIPVDELKPFLTDTARRWVDLDNDVAETFKLAGKEP